MTLIIPEDVLQSAHMSEAEMRIEIAVMLFASEKLTLGQAARLAALDRIAFQHLLASRRISPNYGIAEFEADLETLDQRTG